MQSKIHSQKSQQVVFKLVMNYSSKDKFFYLSNPLSIKLYDHENNCLNDLFNEELRAFRSIKLKTVILI